MDVSTLVALFVNDPKEVLVYGAAISGFSAWICTRLSAPTSSSGKIYRAVYGVLNWLGANKGKATNADDARWGIR